MKNIIGDTIGVLAEYIADLACGTAKQKFDGKINETKLKKTICEFAKSQKKYQEAALLCEEIDYQGLYEYISSKYLDLVVNRCFCVNSKQRERAREEIVSAACSYCNAYSDEAQKRVSIIMYNGLDIIRNFYKSEFSIRDYFFAGEIVDSVTESIGEKIESVQSDVEHIKKSIDLLNVYSPEAYAELAKEGKISEIQSRLEDTFYFMSKEHPLYPDFGYRMIGEKLLSHPLTPDAKKKYPSRYLCKGVLYLGKQIITQEDALNMDILEYADRHQLQLKLEMHDVIKMLGEIKDPSQAEAEAMEGKIIVREPKEFPPAIACAISVDNEVMFDYLELRTKEILDDGTYIIDNSEQKNCHIYIMIRTKMTNNGNVDFTLNIDRASNIELYHYVRFMKAASEGAEVDVKVLNVGKIFCSGFINTASYNCGFLSIDEELQFLKNVCDIEKYVGNEINVPEEITEKQMQNLSYLAGLVRGEEQTFQWDNFSMSGIIDDNFRKKIVEMGTNEHEVSFVGNFDVPLFDQTVHLSLVRRFNHAVVSNYDKIIRKLEVLDDGEDIKISFVCKSDDSGADYLNTNSEIETSEKYAGCFAKKIEK